MKKLVFIFLLFCAVSSAQTLTVSKAVMQTVNHGASPTSSTTYTITLNKTKRVKWHIDSLISIAAGEPVKYNIVKVDDPGAASPKYEKVNYFSSSDLGIYQITFGVNKQRGTGRPGAPQNTKVDTTNIEGGVYLYYTLKKKHKRFKIVDFEKLETINAP